MGNVRILVTVLLLLALAACSGKNGSDTDGGSNLPGKGPKSCFCKADELCIEIFDGLCNPVSIKPQCMSKSTNCKTSDMCGSCVSNICGSMKCCDKVDCSWGYLKACRNADPSKNYYTCTGQ